jgi:hypothetical protein
MNTENVEEILRRLILEREALEALIRERELVKTIVERAKF